MDEVLDEFLAAVDEFDAATAEVTRVGLVGPGEAWDRYYRAWDRHDRASARLARVWGRRAELAAAVRRLRADLAAERERCAMALEYRADVCEGEVAAELLGAAAAIRQG